MNDLQAQMAEQADAVEARVLAVLRSGRYVGGPVLEEAERAVAALMGVRHGVGVNSGTDALVLSLEALGVGPGDEVIVPAISFFSTAGAVTRVGARPVVVDVLADRPLLDPDAARAALTPRTRAVIAVHLFGDAAPHPALGVPVLDDAAQAIGSDPPVGRGEIRALSFYPTKVLGGVGDGGMALTDDPELARRVRSLGSHGMTELHLHVAVAGHVGTNSRLDAIQAAAILGQLPGLSARLAQRRWVAARYDAALGGLNVPRDPGSPVSVYAIRHARRDVLASALAARGIETAVYYPRALTEQPALAPYEVDPSRTPEAVRWGQELLALPCHPGLGSDDVDAVIETLREVA